MWRGEAAWTVPSMALLALFAAISASGCRAILGIGDDEGSSAEEHGDASTTPPVDAIDGRADGGLGAEGGSAEAQAPIDRRYAAWPLQPDALVPATYVVEPDLVLDTSTSLVWQRRPAHVATANLADTTAFCEALVLGGKDDWRVPTRIELLSIFDYDSDTRGMLSAALFDGLDYSVPQITWTASRSLLTSPKSLPFALDVSLGRGFVMQGDTGLNGVRCVRGGVATMPKDRWVVGEAIARDAATRLEWRLAAHPQLMIHADARGACATVPTEGGQTWRLPTARELQSVVDEAKTGAPVHAPGLLAGTVSTEWTATIRSANESAIVDFGTGVGGWSNNFEAYAHRCVRSY